MRRCPAARSARATRHADLHGRRIGDGLRARRADAAGDGQEHLPRRRTGRRPGGEDLQQHDAGDQHDRRVARAFCWRRSSASTGTSCTQITTTATGQSWALTNYCPAPGPVPAAPSNRDYAPGFMAALMLKDMKLSQAAADATGSPTPLGAHAAAFYQAVVDAGDGAQGFFRRVPLAGNASWQDKRCTSPSPEEEFMRGEATWAAEAFKAARDFLFTHRTDYRAAYRAVPLAASWTISTTRWTGSMPSWRGATAPTGWR